MIEHTVFVLLYNKIFTDKKYKKVLEYIMIKYIHKYIDCECFYNTNYKIYFCISMLILS